MGVQLRLAFAYAFFSWLEICSLKFNMLSSFTPNILIVGNLVTPEPFKNKSKLRAILLNFDLKIIAAEQNCKKYLSDSAIMVWHWLFFLVLFNERNIRNETSKNIKTTNKETKKSQRQTIIALCFLLTTTTLFFNTLQLYLAIFTEKEMVRDVTCTMQCSTGENSQESFF